MMFATSIAMAGSRGGVYVNLGGGGYGCGPRYYAPPVCYAPRVIYYNAPAVYCQPAPVYYYRSAPVVYVPSGASVYRAPIVAAGVTVSPISFGWRR